MNILSPIKPLGNLVSPSDSERDITDDKMAFDSIMNKINPRSNQSREFKNQYLSQSNEMENQYYGVSIDNAKRGPNV